MFVQGKESVLVAIGEVCTHCKGVVERGGHDIVTSVLAATQRKKLGFREAALKCLEKVRKWRHHFYCILGF